MPGLSPTRGPIPLDALASLGNRCATWLAAHGWLRCGLLTLYYLGIAVALAALYGRGGYTPAPFVYQGF